MPKKKTHQGTKKVFNERPGGTITFAKAGTNHNTGKKKASVRRRKNIRSKLSKGDERRLKSLI